MWTLLLLLSCAASHRSAGTVEPGATSPPMERPVVEFRGTVPATPTPTLATPVAPTIGPGASCIDACVQDRAAAGVTVKGVRMQCIQQCGDDAFVVRDAERASMRTGSRVAVEGRLVNGDDGAALELADGTFVRVTPDGWDDWMDRRVRVIGTLRDELDPPTGLRLVDTNTPIPLESPVDDESKDTGESEEGAGENASPVKEDAGR